MGKPRKGGSMRGVRSFRSAPTMRVQHQNAELLNEEELLFLWKGLVENGQLSISKIQMFMREVAGVSMSVVQARDLLGYMDANGDGRVGMEDFKNFLSIGHLSETDAKSFMWEPKKKFQEENPYYKELPGAEHRDHHHHSHGHHAGDDHEPPRSSGHAALRRASGKEVADQEEQRRNSSKPLTPPDKAPAKRRPVQHSLTHAHTRAYTQAEMQALDSAGGSSHDTHRHAADHEHPHGHHHDSGVHHHRGSAAKVEAIPKKARPPPLTAETEKKIELALLKYEQAQWDKFLAVEKSFKRELFEQFAGPGGDELEVTEYHKMLMKWIPLASWCAPRGLRPADSLASLEYVQRRDFEERGIVPTPKSLDAGCPAAISEDGPAEGGEVAAAPPEARMSFGLWLDVLNGKHRPEEHIMDLRSAHAAQGEGGGN